MREQFILSKEVELIVSLPFKEVSKNLPSHFEILEQFAAKKMLPDVYLSLLNNLNSDQEKSYLSKKLLKIYLYAATKMKDKKLYNWLLKGSLPQTTSQGDSMSILTQNAKKISSLGKNRNKTIDRLTSNRSKLEQKSSKSVEKSLSKNQARLSQIENEYEDQKSILEEIILEIESSLASGRKL